MKVYTNVARKEVNVLPITLPSFLSYSEGSGTTSIMRFWATQPLLLCHKNNKKRKSFDLQPSSSI